MKSHSVRLIVTLWAHGFMEFSRPEYWSGLLFPSPGDLPNPGIGPRSPSLQADSLPTEPPGKPIQFSSVQFNHSVVSDSATPWTAARQASLFFTISWSLLKLMSESVMPPNHLILSSPSLPAFNLSQHQGSFQMSQFFASGGQSIGASALASLLPMNIQD